jgi:hypothetical protein
VQIKEDKRRWVREKEKDWKERTRRGKRAEETWREGGKLVVYISK